MKLEINHKIKTETHTNTWRLNNMLLNINGLTMRSKKEIKRHIERNENENTITQNLWDTAKADRRGKFIALQANLKKQRKILNEILTLHLKKLEEQ